MAVYRWGVPLPSRTVRIGRTSGQPLRFRADTFARRQKERAYLFDIWSRVGYTLQDLQVCHRGEVHDGLVRFNRRRAASPAKYTYTAWRSEGRTVGAGQLRLLCWR